MTRYVDRHVDQSAFRVRPGVHLYLLHRDPLMSQVTWLVWLRYQFVMLSTPLRVRRFSLQSCRDSTYNRQKEISPVPNFRSNLQIYTSMIVYYHTTCNVERFLLKWDLIEGLGLIIMARRPYSPDTTFRKNPYAGELRGCWKDNVELAWW